MNTLPLTMNHFRCPRCHSQDGYRQDTLTTHQKNATLLLQQIACGFCDYTQWEEITIKPTPKG